MNNYTKDDNTQNMLIDIQRLDTSTYVFKSHNLIESGYDFNLNEQRLTYLASKKLKPRYIKSNIKPSQLKTLLAHETFKDIKIYVNEFKESFNLSSNNMYKVLEETASSLKRKVIQYMQDDGTFVEKNWVITCKYNQEEKFVELTFHPDLIMDLLVLRGKFGRMEYSAVKKFKSSYAFRIYELLQNYAYKGSRSFELEDLRYKLGIYEDTKYAKYSEFKRNVLIPSIKAINTHTNLCVDLKEVRRGRKVEIINFEISQKATPILAKDNYSETIEISQVNKMNAITGIRLSAGQVSELTNVAIEAIKTHNIDMAFYEYIEYAVEIVKEYSQKTTVYNYYGCLKEALQNYWQPNIIVYKENESSFHNFDEREYDYDKLERALVYNEIHTLEECTKKKS